MKRINKYGLSLMLVLFNSLMLNAQTSVIQDTKGETTLAIGNAGVVALNAKDESISFSYGISLIKQPLGENALPPTIQKYLGLTVKAKGKNGLANVIKDGDFQYDGSFGIFYATELLDTNIMKKWGALQFYGSADLLFNQFKLYNSTMSFADQVFSENQPGYKLTLGINQQHAIANTIPYVLGFSVNGGHKNNTADLKAMDIADYSTVVDPVTSNQRIIEKNKTAAYDVNSYKESLGYFNFNVDIGPQFFRQYLLLFHSRLSAQQERKPQWNPAVGLYFTKKGAPLEAVAGIQLQVADYFNTANSIKSRSDRTMINVVAGFSF